MTKRKGLLLVSLFMVFGLVSTAGSALAQQAATFRFGSGTNYYGRAEGLAEEIGAITISNQDAGTVVSGTEIVVFFTANSSPGGTAGSTIGAPINVWSIGTVRLVCQGAGPSPWAGGVCNDIGTPYLSSSLISHTPLPSAPYLHIPFNAPAVFPGSGSSGAGTMSIYARVNVANGGIPGAPSPVGTTIYPGAGNVYAVLSSTSGSLTFTPYEPSSSLWVLQVHSDPALSLGWGVYCSGLEGPGITCETSSTAYVLLCLGVIHHSEQYERYFTVNVDEEFANALTSLSFEENSDTGSTSPGIVTNPTLITVVLQHIPTNFGITAGDPIPCSSVTAPGVPCAGGTLAVSVSGSDHYWNSTPGNSGTATFEYSVDYEDNGGPENVNLPFKFYSAGPITTSALPCVTLTIYKNPEYSAGTNAIPVFLNGAVEGGGPLSVICFNNCETNLLFPFVINYGPWDTDVAIANTTLDPLFIAGAAQSPPDLLEEKGTATPQAGVCWMYYFSGGATPFASTWITPTIVAGSIYAVDLQANGDIPGVTSGYLWAKCFFADAYGYAAVIYIFGLTNMTYASYLAINIPDPEWSPRDLNGDGMGENSITPINLTRRLKYFLAGWR